MADEETKEETARGFVLGDDEALERTAVVNLNELRKDLSGKRQLKDRHLLVRARGAQLGQVLKLGQQSHRVGRANDCEIWLSDDGVSRRHATILFESGVYTIEDTGSANGTFVGGQKVERATLRDGDLIQFGPQAVFRYSVADEGQEQLLRQLYEASVTDALTGANNREHFDSQLRMELSFSRRHGTDLSVVMFDVDHFKRVNDTFGHPVGDEVLVEISKATRRLVRNEDVFARYGGEEFVLILRGIALDGARVVGERLRERIAELSIVTDKGPLKVTVSVGCASFASTPEATAESLVQLADKRLYAAKRGGRNRVVADGSDG
ncbi:MAG TPA: GGDEF domain-containing protein [Polyangiaceae bacterium]|nr:GGDEF domain-containing protein [Polyangiaceae bacterium]